ncbi:hypothetical protein [Litoribacillus peritrichatus]|uniref:Uncharacterized protein n=1 Tax=Litoribacillus peritrichatus TaxID=718191 RepID=A0ABP7N506_9GAMM
MKLKSYILPVLVSMSSVLSHADSLWMTDGSPVDFADTIKIEEAKTPESLLGGHVYEGAVDPLVVFGTYQLPVDESAYVSVEAEWVLILPDTSGEIDLDTPVKLQGMIDGKYFAEFLENQTHWLPASIGNNLIASGPGIETTLRAILAGDVNATIELSYEDKWGLQQTFTSNSLSLAELPLLALVNGVLHRDGSVQYVNLGAIESSSAFVNAESIRTVAILRSVLELPTSGLPLSLESLTQLTLKNISKVIVNHRKYMATYAEMKVTDASGNEIGSGYLILQ